MSYLFDIGKRRRTVARLIGRVRHELVKAFLEEQGDRKITRDDLAKDLGVHRSVITRRLNGSANLTLRSIAEMAEALNRDISFSLVKQETARGSNLHLGGAFAEQTATTEGHLELRPATTSGQTATISATIS